MGRSVRITDVAPRDGLQNEPGIIGTDEKIRLVELLSRTGVAEVEVSSFVSKKWVPQLGDAAEVFDGLALIAKPAGVLFSALVPNERGMDAALAVNTHAGYQILDKASVFTAASETFSLKNTNATIDHTIERFEPVVRMAKEGGLALRGYVSCVVACPFEGAIAPAAVAAVARRLADLGIPEIDLGDTIGAGTPDTIAAVVDAVRGAVPEAELTLHLHDTFHRAADCVRAALERGVLSFDGAVGGLGGCPFASRPGHPAPGNISTATLVKAVESAGFSTGVDLGQLDLASKWAERIVRESTEGRP